MSLILEEVITSKAKKAFIDFPHELYKGDSNYVPELHIAQAELMSPKKNPFFEHSKAQLFVAKKDGKIVGRIAVVTNNNYNDYHQSNVGFFGFFDVINDSAVAELLLDKAKEIHNKNGFDSLIGPTNFTTNDTAGVLVEGYDLPPVIMMTYNFPYYNELLANYGFQKEMDILAYKIPTKTVSDKSIRMTKLLEERLSRKNITVRNFNKKDFKNEVDKIQEVYNKAWSKNWGFVPASAKEAERLANELKMIIDNRYVFIAEDQGKAIGMLVALPNINELTIKMKKGRLLPTGIFKLLMGKSKTKIVRIITMGVIEEYRQMGIEGVLYGRIIQAARDYGIDFGEASWILENNQMMNAGIEKLNGELYKRYRIYAKPLS